MNKRELLLSKIEHAKSDVSAAEAALETLLAEMRALPRAEKTTVSQVMEAAFTKLRAAKADLAELDKLVTEPDE